MAAATSETLVSSSETCSRSMIPILSTYIGSSRDRLLEQEVTDLLEHYDDVVEAHCSGLPLVGRLSEGRAIMLVGQSGAGKSRALQRVFAEHGHFTPESLVSVVAPAPCTLKQLGNTVLDGLGYPRTRDLAENVVWDVVRTQLRALGVRFLHIDELQHLFQARKSDILPVRNMLKALLNQRDWPMFLFLSGMPQIESDLAEDVQIRRRCRAVHFHSLGERDRLFVRRTLDALAEMACLGDADLSRDDFIVRLMHAGLNELGICIEIIQDAIKRAFSEDADTLRVTHFAAVYFSRSGCLPEDNVFTAQRWWEINVRSSFGLSEPGEARR